MKKYLQLFIIIFFPFPSFTQPLNIKEQYDRLLPIVQTQYNYNNLITNDDHHALGDGMSFVLASFLNMFEATKDKAYLIRFINECLRIQAVRKDVSNPVTNFNHPTWTEPDHDDISGNAVIEDSYMSGLIIWPMARFYYLVKTEPALANTILPVSLDIIFPPNNLGTIPLSTFGTFATWLKDKVDNTLTYYHDYYWNDFYGYRRVLGADHASIINWQSGFACALLYLGLPNNDNVSGIPSYLVQANIIAGRYHGTNSYHVNGIPYQNNVLFVNPTFNAYQWYLNGWDGEDPVEYEDMGHATQTLLFPIAANEVGYFFTLNDMIKFHNTFTKHLWNGYGYHNNVFGTDDNIRLDDHPYDDMPFDHFRYLALNFMPLYKFDGYGNSFDNIYSRVINFYQYNVPGITTWGQFTSFGVLNPGSLLYGLSTVVKAQWTEESCIDLRLLNRDLKYDQDFNTKNKLVVSPAISSNSNAFADPTSFTANQFIIRSGKKCVMTAGESITLEEGFEAEAGSDFEAYLTGDPCSQYRTANPNSSSDETAGDATTRETNTYQTSPILSQSNLKFSFNIYPIPTKDEEHFSFSIPEKSEVSIVITNLFGETISTPLNKETKEAGNFEILYDSGELASGVYFCTFIYSSQKETKKMVVLR